MITPEFVMQKLAEPFDARDVAKPLKDEPLTRPLYNEYMRDSRKPKAPALPPRVQMQVGTPTLNQQRMDQDVASFGERLGGSELGDSINSGLAAQRVKAADEPQKTVRKITPTIVKGVGRGGKGSTPLQQAGNAVTAAAPVAKKDRIADVGKKIADVGKKIAEGVGGLGITKEQVEAEIAKRKPAQTKPTPAPVRAQPTAAGNFKAGFSPTFDAVRNFNETMLGGVGKYITGPIGGTIAGTLAGAGNALISNNDPTGPAYERWRNEIGEYGNTPRARAYFNEAVADPNFASTHQEFMRNNPGKSHGMSGFQYVRAAQAGLR